MFISSLWYFAFSNIVPDGREHLLLLDLLHEDLYLEPGWLQVGLRVVHRWGHGTHKLNKDNYVQKKCNNN